MVRQCSAMSAVPVYSMYYRSLRGEAHQFVLHWWCRATSTAYQRAGRHVIDKVDQQAVPVAQLAGC